MLKEFESKVFQDLYDLIDFYFKDDLESKKYELAKDIYNLYLH